VPLDRSAVISPALAALGRRYLRAYRARLAWFYRSTFWLLYPLTLLGSYLPAATCDACCSTGRPLPHFAGSLLAFQAPRIATVADYVRPLAFLLPMHSSSSRPMASRSLWRSSPASSPHWMASGPKRRPGQRWPLARQQGPARGARAGLWRFGETAPLGRGSACRPPALVRRAQQPALVPLPAGVYAARLTCSFSSCTRPRQRRQSPPIRAGTNTSPYRARRAVGPSLLVRQPGMIPVITLRGVARCRGARHCGAAIAWRRLPLVWGCICLVLVRGGRQSAAWGET
jgi:hypothetical protein